MGELNYLCQEKDDYDDDERLKNNSNDALMMNPGSFYAMPYNPLHNPDLLDTHQGNLQSLVAVNGEKRFG